MLIDVRAEVERLSADADRFRYLACHPDSGLLRQLRYLAAERMHANNGAHMDDAKYYEEMLNIIRAEIDRRRGAC